MGRASALHHREEPDMGAGVRAVLGDVTGLGKALRSDRQVSIEGPEDGDLAGYVTQDSSHTRTHQISPFHVALIHGRGPQVDSRRLVIHEASLSLRESTCGPRP